jgi:metallo-beta-lactamase class B
VDEGLRKLGLNPADIKYVVATHGYKLTLGDTTLTLYITPGHTEGTISTLIPVRDNGRAHVAAAWGGTLFNFGPIRPRLAAYAQSAERFRDIAAKANADVILSNHTVYDGSKTKLPAVKARKPGEPHPYVVGNDVVQRYLTTVGECAQAALAIVPPA